MGEAKEAEMLTQKAAAQPVVAAPVAAIRNSLLPGSAAVGALCVAPWVRAAKCRSRQPGFPPRMVRQLHLRPRLHRRSLRSGKERSERT